MPFDRYNSEVIGRLHRYQQNGLGNIIELAEISEGSERVPMVGFEGRGEARTLITARHHSPDFYCTDAAIYRMIEKGAEGFIAVPVVDVRSYDAAQDTKDRWLSRHPDLAAAFLWDVFTDRGLPAWSGVPIRDWDHWDYMVDEGPAETKGVKSVMDGHPISLVMDLHGSRGEYIFVTSSGGKGYPWTQKKMLESLRENGQVVDEGAANHFLRPMDTPGFYELSHGTDICTYSAALGIENYGVCMPFFSSAGGDVSFRDRRRLLRANAALLSAAVGSNL